MASGTIKAVVAKSDIVNNLTTNDSAKALSAAQGKALNDKIITYNDNGVSRTLTSGDLDTVKTPGRYYATSNVSNIPYAGASGYLDVYVYDSNRVAQTFRQFNDNKVYERRLISGTWGSWTSLNDQIGNLFEVISGNINVSATGTIAVEISSGAGPVKSSEYLFINAYANDNNIRRVFPRIDSGRYYFMAFDQSNSLITNTTLNLTFVFWKK